MSNEILINDSENIPQVNPNGEFGVVMSTVQPRSSLGRAMVTILAYSLESRRLGMEAERIQLAKYKFDKQVEVARENIYAATEARLAEIDYQKECMLKGLALYEYEIQNTNLTRKQLIKLIDEMSNNMTHLVRKKNVNTAAIKELRSLLTQFTSQLVKIETQAHEKSLKQLSPLLSQITDTRQKLGALTYEV